MIGHEELLGTQCLLRKLLDMDSVPNMILWGPPGCGKTTIARTIAGSTRAAFESISAVGYMPYCSITPESLLCHLFQISSGVGTIKEVVERAAAQKSHGRKTILFIDEIHRFNKAQQDSLLPHVESGLFTLVGATTENPSFELNSALLSRCRVFQLSKLPPSIIEQLLRRALSQDSKLSANPCSIEDAAIAFLAQSADGDARCALAALEMAVEIAQPDDDGIKHVSTVSIRQSLQKSHLEYDKDGEQHYNMISAFHKSIRGSDADAALYYLARMLGGGEVRSVDCLLACYLMPLNQILPIQGSKVRRAKNDQNGIRRHWLS